MSKPNHRNRGKGRYIGYGYSTTDLAFTQAKIHPYRYYLSEEINAMRNLGLKVSAKLEKYLNRANGL